MAERVDNIGFGNLRLIQDTEEFCYGIDAVILSDFAAKLMRRQDSIADLGTGTGIIPLILSHKTKTGRITGFEVQESSYEKAMRNIEINGLHNRLEFICTNVTEIPDRYFGCFDAVTCNPPYAKGGAAILSAAGPKAIARHEILATLEDFIKAGSLLLRDRGEFFMVHRPSRLVDILTIGRKYRLEAKTMRLVSPREGTQPNIVLVHFVKGGGSELKVMPPLYVYEDDRVYTEDIQSIYERD